MSLAAMIPTLRIMACLAACGRAVEPKYTYTLDCDAFTPPSMVAGRNTCNEYGSEEQWKPIIDRPVPSWYMDMKLGIFIHWGVYSVPSFGGEWFWHNYQCGDERVKAFADKNFPEVGENYPKYAELFHAELFNADEWVRIFKDAGAQYILPVAKHHDGFCMWNASSSSPQWNAVEVGPKRDVLTELYDASISSGLSFGIYYSQGEWFDADFVADYHSNFTRKDFIAKKVIPQRLDLIARFDKAMLWHTDGGWMAPDAYWNNLDWLTGLYSESPMAEHVASCNSMGVGCCQTHNGKCWEYGDAPSGGDRTIAGGVVSHFYTNQMTIQRGSWSWDRSEASLSDFFDVDELVYQLVSTTAWNGTLIVNVGPTSDGTIPPIFQDRLHGLGKWLATNGEAIYGTRPWSGALPTGAEPMQSGKDPSGRGGIFYTSTSDAVYAIALAYPVNGVLPLTLVRVAAEGETTADFLTDDGPISTNWAFSAEGGIDVMLPGPPLGSSNGWVVRLRGVQGLQVVSLV